MFNNCKWEYQILVRTELDDPQYTLDVLGADGWELVTYGEEIAMKRRKLQIQKADKPREIPTPPAPLEPRQDSIDSLGLGSRAYNALARKNLMTLDLVTQMTVKQLSRIKGMGELSIKDLSDCLAKRGLCLRVPEAGSKDEESVPEETSVSVEQAIEELEKPDPQSSSTEPATI